MDIDIQIDTKPLEVLADAFGGTQAKYARAKLLTTLAKDSQADLKSTEGQYVHLRTPHTLRGIRIQPAKKNGPPFALVGTIDPVMGELVTGDARVPDGKAREMMIPKVGAGLGRESIDTVVKPSQFPAQLKARDPDVFIGMVRMPSGHKILGVWRRRKQLLNSAGDTKNRVTLLFDVKQEAKMHRTWPMDSIVRGTVGRQYGLRAMEVLTEIANSAHTKIGR